MSAEGSHWFCFRTLFVHEPIDEAIEEFIDDDFIADWKGIERSTYLVWAHDEQHARRELHESTEAVAPSANVYGQKLRDRALSIELRGIVELDPPRQWMPALEVHWEFWYARTDTDAVAFLEQGRPLPTAACAMLQPLAAGEPTRKYRELRGAVTEDGPPHEDVSARPVRTSNSDVRGESGAPVAGADSAGSGAWRWYGVQLRSMLETLDAPIDELLDEWHEPDWMGIEVAYLFVSARRFEDVDRLVAEREDGRLLVNAYGQRVRRGVLETTWIEIDELFHDVVSEERVIALCRDVWDTSEDHDAREFLKSTQPVPVPQPHMIRPIAFYEHRARYEELRGTSGV